MTLLDIQNEALKSCLDKSYSSQNQKFQEIYSDLVEHSHFLMIEKVFSETKNHLAENWDKLREEFLKEVKVTSRYYRDIPNFFFTFLKKKTNDPFALELSDYEFTRYSFIFKENFDVPETNFNLDLDQAIVILNPLTELKNYSFPVHKPENKSEATRLLIYRHPETFEIHNFELNDKSYDFLKFVIESNKPSVNELMNNFSQNENEETLAFLGELIKLKIIVALVADSKRTEKGDNHV